MIRYLVFSTIILSVALTSTACAETPELLARLDSPIIIRGDSDRAFRDPAIVYHDGVFHLFYTLVRTEDEVNSARWGIYSYTAHSTSTDLKTWSQPRIITPRGMTLNYSSPGNVVRFGGRWVLCLQTYPRLDYYRGDRLRWADSSARIFTMRSDDLETWDPPELLRVKGPDVPREAMGRMIDPYLIEDRDMPGRWWCFYKQGGVSMSYSNDLVNWTYAGRTDSGENVCVLRDGDEYVLMHSPGNGLGLKRSKDLKEWRDWGPIITLDQKDWPWAEVRLTAGCLLDMRDRPDIGHYLLFFHGVGPGPGRNQDNADANCSLGIAWSKDLQTWHWPGGK